MALGFYMETYWSPTTTPIRHAVRKALTGKRPMMRGRRAGGARSTRVRIRRRHEHRGGGAILGVGDNEAIHPLIDAMYTKRSARWCNARFEYTHATELLPPRSRAAPRLMVVAAAEPQDRYFVATVLAAFVGETGTIKRA